jgi:hypothetical protein
MVPWSLGRVRGGATGQGRRGRGDTGGTGGTVPSPSIGMAPAMVISYCIVLSVDNFQLQDYEWTLVGAFFEEP